MVKHSERPINLMKYEHDIHISCHGTSLLKRNCLCTLLYLKAGGSESMYSRGGGAFGPKKRPLRIGIGLKCMFIVHGPIFHDQ